MYRIQLSPQGVTLDLLKDRYVIGRGDECDILLQEDDSTISRRHAVLDKDLEGSWHIVDLASRNGTLVNGERVQDRQRLNPGAVIQIGTSRLTLIATGSVSPTATAPLLSLPNSIVAPQTRIIPAAPIAPITAVAMPVPVVLQAPPRPDTSPVSKVPEYAVPLKPPIVTEAPTLHAVPPPTAAPSQSLSAIGAITSLMITLGLLFSGTLPWGRVQTWLIQGSITYFDLCKIAQEESKRDSRAFWAFLPLLAVGLVALSCLTRGRTRGSLVSLSGLIGAGAAAAVYNYLSSGIGSNVGAARVQVDLTSLLGPGYYLFTTIAVLSIFLGIAMQSWEKAQNKGF